VELKKKSQLNVAIPTASLPDIVFMLIFFFMVSSVLRSHEGLQVLMPKAKQIEKLESKVHVAYIWISKEGLISIDGRLYQPQSVRSVMYEKRTVDPQLIVSIRADELVNMDLISKIHKELRLADALAVNYSTRAL
jgi:biopolymer transport protein ExbD